MTARARNIGLALAFIVATGCGAGRPATQRHERDYEAADRYVQDKLQAARDGKPDPAFETFLAVQTQMRMQAGDYRTALHTAKPLSEYEEIVHGPRALETAAALEMLAEVHCNLKQCAEGIPLLERAAVIYRQRGREATVAYIRTLNSLGAAWTLEKRPDRAQPVLKQSLALSEQRFGDESEQVGVVCWLLVGAYDAEGKTVEASAARTRAERLLPSNGR